jgi:predicted glycosyltransferase
LSRVWIDVLTPKQILFFKPLKQKLESHGFEVLATSRKYRELEPIAEMQGLELVYVGERGGSSKAEQLAAATQRQAEITSRIKRFAPQVSVSVASGVCARVSFGLGVKHVAVNDSPHSEVAGRLSLPLSHHLFCPWVIPYGAWAKFGVARSKITRYHALDPAAWLKRKARRGPVPHLSSKRKTVVVRLEESYAPYMAGTKRSWNDAVLQSLSDSVADVNLVALCRYGDQLRRIKAKFGSRFIIPEEVVDGRSLLDVADVFVGMGGTMTAESALMGVPTISAFQGSLYTEDYLTSVGLLRRAGNPARVAIQVNLFLKRNSRKELSKRARGVLSSMEDPIPKIARYVAATAREA